LLAISCRSLMLLVSSAAPPRAAAHGSQARGI
jgi:hypothetical protein